MVVEHGGACGRRWARWATRSVVHGKPAGGRLQSAIVHKSTVPAPWRWSCLPQAAQPVPPVSLELVPQHRGVQLAAFVAKPEQLPERTSYDARMGYDER